MSYSKMTWRLFYIYKQQHVRVFTSFAFVFYCTSYSCCSVFLLFQPSDFTRVIFFLVLYFVCVVLYSYLRNCGLLRLFAASINECIAENFAVFLSPYHNGQTKKWKSRNIDKTCFYDNKRVRKYVYKIRHLKIPCLNVSSNFIW